MASIFALGFLGCTPSRPRSTKLFETPSEHAYKTCCCLRSVSLSPYLSPRLPPLLLHPPPHSCALEISPLSATHAHPIPYPAPPGKHIFRSRHHPSRTLHCSQHPLAHLTLSTPTPPCTHRLRTHHSPLPPPPSCPFSSSRPSLSPSPSSRKQEDVFDLLGLLFHVPLPSRPCPRLVP